MKKLISAFFDKQFLKFCLVGVVNTLVGYGLMFALYNLFDCSERLSMAANIVVGSVVSYFLNKRFTFDADFGGWGQILRFSLNIAVCYAAANLIAEPLALSLLSGVAQPLRGNISMVVRMVIFTGLNYLGQRFFAFKKPEKDEKGGETP